jgi:hypothetical protein
MRTLRSRAPALWLLLALLGGGFGLPLYDAAAYHMRLRSNHVEGNDAGIESALQNHALNRPSHAASCVLGLITLAGRGTPALGPAFLLATLRLESAPLPSPAAAPELIRFSSIHSRAPPVVTA